MINRTVTLFVDLEVCHACRRCQASQVCRMKAIVQVDPDEPPYIDIERCRDCQVCVSACPFGALRSANSSQ